MASNLWMTVIAPIIHSLITPAVNFCQSVQEKTLPNGDGTFSNLIGQHNCITIPLLISTIASTVTYSHQSTSLDVLI